MASLAEVYEDVGARSLRRLYLGTGLFLVGAAMLVIAILIATTGALAAVGIGVIGARELAGVLAGLGAPAVFVGIFTVLPASPRERAAAGAGASIALFGVILFTYAYPGRWTGMSPDLTLPVVAVYFLGTITTFWSMFTAVVNFKTRNDPGGTVTLERTVAGETRRVEVPLSRLEGETVSGGDLGGVGLFGEVAREQVMAESDEGSVETSDATASDGGTRADDGLGTPADRYCGNCRHFEYVRTDDGIQPYCGFHGERMGDMDPCERWQPNAPR